MQLPNYKEAKERSKKIFEREEYLPIGESNLGRGKTYFIKTYGCQMNEHDSENLGAMLEELGYTAAKKYTDADLVLLNTCSIRENAHNKAFGMLGRFKHLKEERPDVVVGVCGCMAQEEGVVKRLLEKYKWVNFIFGTHNLHRLPYLLNEATKNDRQEVEVFSKEGNLVEGIPVKRDKTYKGYVNIIYGCDKFCTYCIVPYTRGKQRSRTKEDILKEVNELITQGYQEVTLLGQTVNAYGKDFEYDYNMENLLEDVAKTNIPRVRFMTSHPWDFTDRMIEIIAQYKNIMPAIHLPVQSGSSNILKRMGRRYTKEEYLTLFFKIKKSIPNCSISTDIIVGFPGETNQDFEETMDLVEQCQYDNAFTFTFSKREGTPACKLEDTTDETEKQERLYRLNERVNYYFLKNNQRLLHKIVPVLVEGTSSKYGLYGYTDTNKLINFKGEEDLVGKIVNVKVTLAKTWSLDGELYE